MIVKECRLVMPFSLEEYRAGILWTLCEGSRLETGGGDGVEIKENHPFTDQKLMVTQELQDGQFTYKVYHLYGKLPSLLKTFFTRENCQLHERAYNAFPYCETHSTNPGYLKDRLRMEIHTVHVSDDKGEQENALNLSEELLKKREVVRLDLADDKHPLDAELYNVNTARSEKTGRGPLAAGWADTATGPYMCVYNVMIFECRKFALQTLVERCVSKQAPRVMKRLHRQMFCWTDRWYGLTLEDVRRFEEETAQQLDRQRQEEAARGTVFQ